MESLPSFHGTGDTEGEAVAQAESFEREHFEERPIPAGRTVLTVRGGRLNDRGDIAETVAWTATIHYEDPSRAGS